MGRDSALFRLYSQVDFEEIRLNGGRKKKTAKKVASTKAKADGKGKEKITFSEPSQHTEDEEWASERTDTKKTEDDRTVLNEDGSAQSPKDAAPNTNTETTEGGEEVDKETDDEGDNTEREEAEEAEADRITGNLLQSIRRKAESVEELYLEWHEHRFDTPYRQILPGHTDEQCIRRLEEVEDLMMNVTNSNTLQEVQHRTCLLLPKTQLRKLKTKIRKIKEELNKMESVGTLAPRVLARLEKAKGELIQEVERLEAICSRMKVPVYNTPVIERFPVDCPTPPREDTAPIELPKENAAPIESSERADPNLTERSPPPPPEVLVSDVTKEWVEDRIKEFDETTVQPFKVRFGRIVDSALKFTDATKNLLESHQERCSDLGKGLWDVAVQQDKCVQRTTILEDVTSELKKDLDRLERDTDQRLNTMSGDLIGTTLTRVSELEKINGGLVAEDALDAEAGKDKEAPRSSQLTEAEVEAARIQRGEALFPGFADKVATLAAEDAERLEREARRLEGYAKENEKKKKAAASASAPKKRKREATKKEALKKVQIAELLREVSEPVIPSTSEQDDQIEDEVEAQLRSRSTRRRSSEPTGRQQPKKKSIYELTDSD
ncbi:uncharacterized protein LOC124917481 [Impatiens glandulifera]|uniref:uncharacterized protein LOC124917481 n=1 Tax=Impatiens glandulifera TaxID=253017 RepID=UPI001FB19B4B|nr:uncharacterized protein LOC124917481 [Impatiens glandulifera]